MSETGEIMQEGSLPALLSAVKRVLSLAPDKTPHINFSDVPAVRDARGYIVRPPGMKAAVEELLNTHVLRTQLTEVYEILGGRAQTTTINSKPFYAWRLPKNALDRGKTAAPETLLERLDHAERRIARLETFVKRVTRFSIDEDDEL